MRPNILLIITDQQRWDAAGYVDPMVNTPHLNALAAKSVVCEATYVQCGQCQPNRASIQTGRYPTAHRVWWNETPLNKGEVTIGNRLRSAGYSTAYFGKMHLTDADGDGWERLMGHFGYDTIFLFWHWMAGIGQSLEEEPEMEFWDAPKPRHSFKAAREEFHAAMADKSWTGRFSQRETHHEEVITDRAIDYMGQAKPPFFMTVGFHGPHPPYACPEPFSSLYDPAQFQVPVESKPNNNGYVMSADDWRLLKSQYFGAISWIDNCIGRLLVAMPENTIVIFTADHGDILGDHGLFSKGIYAYEGNTRVPLILSVPGWAGGQYSHLAQSIDIHPTILELAGLGKQIGVQGSSLIGPILNNVPVRDYALSMIGLWRKDRLRMLRHANWKYWIHGDKEFLFDLAGDPGELRNQAGSEPAVISEMRYRLVQALIDAEDPCPVPR